MPDEAFIGSGRGTPGSKRLRAEMAAAGDRNLTLLATATIAKLRRPHTLGVWGTPWKRPGGVVAAAIDAPMGGQPTARRTHPHKSGRLEGRATRLW
jgi:hypothetical protein